MSSISLISSSAMSELVASRTTSWRMSWISGRLSRRKALHSPPSRTAGREAVLMNASASADPCCHGASASSSTSVPVAKGSSGGPKGVTRTAS